jgi:hypothetical protein
LLFSTSSWSHPTAVKPAQIGLVNKNLFVILIFFPFLEPTSHHPHQFQIVSFFEYTLNETKTNHIFYDYGAQILQNFSWQQDFFGSHQVCPTSDYQLGRNWVYWAFSTEYQIAVFNWSNINTLSDNNNLIYPQPIGPIPSRYIQSSRPSYVVFKGIYLFG